MTERQRTDQRPEESIERENREVMTEAGQEHGTGGQTANVEGGVGRFGALASQSNEQEVDDRGAAPPA